MSSWIDCIVSKVGEGKVTEEDIAEILSDYKSLYAEMEGKVGPDMAAKEASIKALDKANWAFNTKKRNEIRQQLKNIELVNHMDSVWQQGKGSGFNSAFVIASDVYHAADKVSEGVRRRYAGMLGQFFNDFSPGWFNIARTPKHFDDAVLAAMGGKGVSKVAQDMGKGVRKVLDTIWEDHHAVGGIMGKIENYFPVVHPRQNILALDSTRAGAKQKWVDFIFDKVPENKYPIDEFTGERMTGESYREALNDVFESIVEDGTLGTPYATMPDATMKRPRSMANRRNHTRFILFESPEDYMDYFKFVGINEQGLFSIFDNYVSNMSRDIGLMSFLGANPNSSARTISAWYRGKAGKGFVANSFYNLLEKQHKILMGLGGDHSSKLWRGMMNSTHYMRAQYTGNSALLTPMDLALSTSNARLSGLPVTRSMWNAVKMRLPQWMSPDKKRLAGLTEYKMNAIWGNVVGDMRHGGDLGNNGVGTAYANAVNTVTANNYFTDAARMGSMADVLNHLADYADGKKTVNNKAFKEVLSLFQLSDAELGMIKSFNKHVGDFRGEKINMFNPAQFSAADRANPVYMALVKKYEDMYIRTGFFKALERAREGKLKPLGRGLEMEAFDAGNYVVKIPTNERLTKQYRQRFLVETILGDAGIMPKTFMLGEDRTLVSEIRHWAANDFMDEPSSQFGFIQEKVEPIGRNPKKPVTKEEILDIKKRLLELGLTDVDLTDAAWKNMGRNKAGKLVIIDPGFLQFTEVRGAKGGNKFKQLWMDVYGTDPEGVNGKSITDWLEKNQLTKTIMTMQERQNVRSQTLLEWDELHNQAHEFAKETISGVARKVDAMTNYFAALATNSPNPLTRVVTTGMAPAGTAQRWFSSTWSMLLSWPISATYNNLARPLSVMARDKGRGSSAIAINTAVGYMMYRYVVEPMYNWAMGKTNEEDNPNAQFRAIMKSGSMGIISDLLFEDYRFYGSSPEDMLVGPVFSGMGDQVKRNFSLGRDLIDGKKDPDEALEKFTKNVMKSATNMVPFSRLWYTRLMYQRMIVDPIMEINDPDYHKNLRRQMKRMQEYEQDFWWAPGDEPEFDRMFETPLP